MLESSKLAKGGATIRSDVLTAALPKRIYVGLLSASLAVIIGNFLLFAGLYDDEYRWAAWLAVGVLLLMLAALYAFIMQLLAYRNPALLLRKDALVYYGTAIPWSAIQEARIVPESSGPDATGHPAEARNAEQISVRIPSWDDLPRPVRSRRYVYYYTKVAMRSTGDRLVLPNVRECSARELADEINLRSTDDRRKRLRL